MITTPQKLAVMVVNKAVHMARQAGVPIMGIVENMAYFRCPDTGKKHFTFGSSHCGSIEKVANAPVLAQICLNPTVAELCDTWKIERVIVDENGSLITAVN